MHDVRSKRVWIRPLHDQREKTVLSSLKAQIDTWDKGVAFYTHAKMQMRSGWSLAATLNKKEEQCAAKSLRSVAKSLNDLAATLNKNEEQCAAKSLCSVVKSIHDLAAALHKDEEQCTANGLRKNSGVKVYTAF